MDQRQRLSDILHLLGPAIAGTQRASDPFTPIKRLAWTCGCTIDDRDAGDCAVAWNACQTHRGANTERASSSIRALKPLGRLTPRTSVETSILGELIQCGCGHPISAHSRRGCEEAQPESCACPFTANDVLEEALSSARTTWGSWSEPV